MKNCIVDIEKVIGPRKAQILHEMNKKGNVTLKTPLGEIGPIKADEVVRQGTIFGPKLCCVNTDQINKGGKKCVTYIGPDIKTETMLYVDDMQNASSNVIQLKNAADNLRRMEQQKGYLFNIQKQCLLNDELP